jgi:hypothetical protein
VQLQIVFFYNSHKHRFHQLPTGYQRQMLDTLLLKQLNDPDPSVRKQAIIALGRTQDQNALPYLATVFKKDRDPELRKLAKKAGLYIRQQTTDIFPSSAQAVSGVSSSSDNDDNDLMSSASTYYEEIELPEPEPVVEVSALNQERAKGLLQQALDANLRGNNDKAVHYFQNALKRNPNLKKESYALSLASTITAIPSGEEAIKTLLADAQKKKRGGGGGQAEENATWGNAFIDLLIYGLINAAVIGVCLYLFFALILPPFSELVAQQAATAAQGRGAAQNTAITSASLFAGMSAPEIMVMIMNQFSIPFTLGYSAAYGVYSIVTMIIFYFFIHVISTAFLGGEGTYRRLVTKATLPQALMTPIATIALAALIIVPILYPDYSGMAILGLFGTGIVYYSVLSLRIGAAYNFSGFTGCGSIILSGIAIGLVSCTLNVVLTSIAVNGFTR